MNNEKQKILDMLEKGTITPADAAKLLECLGRASGRRPPWFAKAPSG